LRGFIIFQCPGLHLTIAKLILTYPDFLPPGRRKTTATPFGPDMLCPKRK